jgi:hypothetical protein
MAWTALSTTSTATPPVTTPSEVRVSVPVAARDASGSERLSFEAAADESVPTGTDLTLSVIDGNGATYSSLVSKLNPLAVNRLPASATSPILKKIVLQQVNVSTSALKAAGLDVADIREVRFAAATGADATTTGAVFLSDLAFESSSVGTPVVKTETTIDVFTPAVDEGNGPGTTDVAVYLSGPTKTPVTGYVSVLGSATSRGGVTMEKVTFAPGETCKVVTAPILGDKAASTTNSTAVKTSVINTAGAVMGKKAFGNIVIREDDGIVDDTSPTTPIPAELPAVGTPGDACAEAAALSKPGSVTISGASAPGGSAVFTATGYRAGEAVTFSLGSKVLGLATADTSGKVVFTTTLPADAQPGSSVVTAVGSGTGFTSRATLEKTATGVSLVLGSDSAVYGSTVRGFATVAGVAGGTVTVTVGGATLSVPVSGSGAAPFTLPVGLSAGRYTVAAVYNGSETVASSSASAPYVVTKKTTAASISAKSSVKRGRTLTVKTTVKGATAGTFPTGSVKVYVKTGGGKYVLKKTVRLTAANKGVVSAGVKVTRKKGTIRIKAVYSGNGNFAGDSSATKGVRVK